MMALALTIDRHTLALISVIGSSLDVLGAMYLAYDLFGGEHGPLRTLTRAVTYGVLFGAGYGLAMGPVFGLTSGLAHGITLAWGFSRASRQKPKPGFWLDTAMSAIRGCGFGLGTAYSFGAAFGATFGGLSAAGQAIAYRIGIRPTNNYRPTKVTAVIGSYAPFVEWTADHVPQRRMGVIGVVLILIGFALQSVQYWAALFDVSVQ